MADDEAIRGILADRNLRFPDHPRLVPDLHVFAMPDGLGIQFRGGPFPTVLRGPKAQTTLECLLPLLDGSRTVDMILAALPAEIAAETVLRTLLLLHQKGLLAGASQQAEREQTRDASQLLFWGRHIDITRNARNAEELNRRIETAHLILVGTGLFGTLVYEALVRTGFRRFPLPPGMTMGILPRSPVVNRHPHVKSCMLQPQKSMTLQHGCKLGLPMRIC